MIFRDINSAAYECFDTKQIEKARQCAQCVNGWSSTIHFSYEPEKINRINDFELTVVGIDEFF